jgi:hypothetical protein
MKIRPVGAELFHSDEHAGGRTDEQTDVTKQKVVFPNFANALKNDECTWLHSNMKWKGKMIENDYFKLL